VDAQNLLGESDELTLARDGTRDIKLPWTPGGWVGNRPILVVLDDQDLVSELKEDDN